MHSSTRFPLFSLILGSLLCFGAAGALARNTLPNASSARKAPLPIGAEVISAACPVKFKILDDGDAWRYICESTTAEIVILKRQERAGLSARTVGDPYADWIR